MTKDTILAGWEDFPHHTQEEWQAAAEKLLKGAPLSRLTRQTLDGLQLSPLAPQTPPLEDAPPGFWPHRRGSQAVLEKAGWLIHQRYWHPAPSENAQALAHDLARGVQGVWLQVATETSEGVVLSHPSALSEISAPLEKGAHALYLLAGSDALAYAAQRITAAQALQADLAGLCGAWCVDPLGTAVITGQLPSSLEAAKAQLASLTRWSLEHTPKMKVGLVSSLPHHNAGASPTQEVAALIATGTTYLRWLCDAGLSIEDAASSLLFEIATTGDIFVEIAKIRAARLLWARVLEASLGETTDIAMHLHARTSPRILTRRDIWVNMLRTTAATFAASAGGAQSIESAPLDALLQAPDAFSRRMAANTQVILQEESHLGKVLDPAGGSWYIEDLTEQIAQAAWSHFQEMEAMGGLPQALATGAWQAKLEAMSDKRHKRIAQRKDAITGVSAFPLIQERTISRTTPSPSTIRQDQQAALQQHLSQHPQDALEQKLQDLDKTDASASFFDALVQAAQQGATIETLRLALQDGASWSVQPLKARRDAERFEQLRDASDTCLQQQGKRPQIFLGNLGPIPQHKARADFARQLFEAGGVEAIDNDGFTTPQELVEAFQASQAAFAVVCSSDAAYATSIETLAPLLKEAGAQQVYLAGKPGEAEEAWRAAGINHFVFMGCDACSVLEELYQSLGIRMNHA
ncbi:MAG: methylmalonyl-CoA mutase [Myxococcales bacterium]|nr:methylmalonyl-CoA mutase [Myxococcales bacterium]